MTRKLEINPGEHFTVSDKVIITSEYETVIGMLSNLSKDESLKGRVGYMMTFTGKLVNKPRTMSVTVAMPPEEAFEFAANILGHLEQLLSANQSTDETPDRVIEQVIEHDHEQDGRPHAGCLACNVRITKLDDQGKPILEASND